MALQSVATSCCQRTTISREWMNQNWSLSNIQSVEALAAVAAFQVSLGLVAARVASEMLDASECIVALGAFEGPLQVAPLCRIESVYVASRAPSYHG